MYRVLKSSKDTYITNKVVNLKSKVSGNVGVAGTLDLFKLHDLAPESVGIQDEISRLLIHFDLTDLKDLWNNNLIDINDDSFQCQLSLKDVYGGQPTPDDFSISVFPLSASFEEGLGKDLVYFSDIDAANWLSSSRGTLWNSEGCSQGGGALETCDYITGSNLIDNIEIKQTFSKGTEDLLVDVTEIISATLIGDLPDRGFRISFEDILETNEKTYFVKRFASRHAYDESKHPKLIIKFNDSIIDDTQNLVFDEDCQINLYNYVKGDLKNLISSSTSLTGSDCIKLKLVTETGQYALLFSGSQFTLGANPSTGIYTSTVNIPTSDETISLRIEESGSVNFTPVWTSNDETVLFVSGSLIKAKNSTKTSASNKKKFYHITVTGINENYSNDQDITARVNIYDFNDPFVKLVKMPVELSGIVLNSVYYSVRNIESGEVVIPFDNIKNSTKVSSDSEGMFFTINSSCLDVERTYVIDIMILLNGIKSIHQNSSSNFRITK